ncbi:MAG: outer membrane lipoprotein carrier protein LolA [Bacteroidales bacterium]|nr:outer membrane lipoprotein carrier protein LolA [Bacteroidales bacterium]MDD4217794.1 outer membrane lipoprotein carrier protein LolA [Bacteroidales bacterium]MDY0140513.1 outer membrane lipoprotein carrier protein LolA [Bacteroidales bacterium]
MKKFIALFSLIFLALVGFSQNDLAATALLDEVSAKTERYVSLKIEFNMYIENLQHPKRDEHKGSAVYKSGLYKLDIMGQIVFSNGTTNWTYLKDAEEVNITDNADNKDAMMNPQSLLKDYKSNFKVRYIADKFEQNRPLVEIDLIPKTIEDKKYSKITVKIDKTKKQIYSVRYIGKDGVSYLIEIYKFVENPAVSDAEIKFSNALFPHAEVIDMR